MNLIVFSDDMCVRKNTLHVANCMGEAHAGSEVNTLFRQSRKTLAEK